MKTSQRTELDRNKKILTDLINPPEDPPQMDYRGSWNPAITYFPGDVFERDGEVFIVGENNEEIKIASTKRK